MGLKTVPKKSYQGRNVHSKHGNRLLNSVRWFQLTPHSAKEAPNVSTFRKRLKEIDLLSTPNIPDLKTPVV